MTKVISFEKEQECLIKLEELNPALYIQITQDYVLISKRNPVELLLDEVDMALFNWVGFDRMDGEAYYQDFNSFENGEAVEESVCQRVISQIDHYISYFGIYPPRYNQDELRLLNAALQLATTDYDCFSSWVKFGNQADFIANDPACVTAHYKKVQDQSESLLQRMRELGDTNETCCS